MRVGCTGGKAGAMGASSSSAVAALMVMEGVSGGAGSAVARFIRALMASDESSPEAAGVDASTATEVRQRTSGETTTRATDRSHRARGVSVSRMASARSSKQRTKRKRMRVRRLAPSQDVARARVAEAHDGAPEGRGQGRRQR